MPTSTTGSSNLFLQPTSATNGVSDISSKYSKFDKSNGYTSGLSSSLNSRYSSSSYKPSTSSSSSVSGSRYRSGSLSGGSISALSSYDSAPSSALSSSRFGRFKHHSHYDYTLPKRTSSFSGPGLNNYDTTTNYTTSTLRSRRNSLTRRPPSLYGGCSSNLSPHSSHSSVVNVDSIVNKSNRNSIANNQLPPLPSASSSSSSKSSALRSSSSLARYVATSGYDMIKQYSPAHYRPNSEPTLLSKSLSEANVNNNSNLNNNHINNNSNHLSSNNTQRERNVESIKGAIKQQQQKHFTSKLTSTNSLRNGNNGTTVTSTLNGTSSKLKDEFLKTEYELLVASKILEFENIASSSATDLKNNNGYHHHHQQHLQQRRTNMNCLDDIKFIDSDEFAGPIPTRPKTSVPTKSSPSTLPLVNKKSGIGSGSVVGTSSVDANSIKASINKFNTLSEMKRIPTRSSTGNLGSSNHHSRSHSHHHHHHNYIINNNISNDNNNYCGSSGSSSCSEKNYKSHSASPSSGTGSGSGSVTNALKKQSSASSPQSSRKASASSIFSTNATNLLKSTVICSASTKQPQHPQQSAATATTASSSSSSLSPKISDPKRDTSSKLSDNDDSIRTTSIRTTLPPSSPTSSRYLDNSASTSSSYKPSRKSTISESENGTTTNGKSANGDSETTDEGLCGLRNIGNTCFMNSVIQCLSHTNELTKFLKSQTYIKNTTKDQQILHEFAKLIREMWTPNIGSVTPHELKSAFSSKHRMYSGYNQQDSQEFLRFFLDSLHCALNSGTKGEHLKIDDSWSDNRIADLTWEWYSKVESSIVKDLFVGQLKSTLKCTVCGNTSVTFDPFWDLSVPLPSSSRCKLDSCLDLFIREEILDGDEKPTCSKCQTRRKCTKTFTIQRFPKYLVIHLKRFSETRGVNYQM
uniref:ubiquitinyl hydrolase 1 n=1 Tax=Megaselia scalaris TaxID=36166 RepID=T1GHH2_MEGSC